MLKNQLVHYREALGSDGAGSGSTIGCVVRRSRAGWQKTDGRLRADFALRSARVLDVAKTRVFEVRGAEALSPIAPTGYLRVEGRPVAAAGPPGVGIPCRPFPQEF